MKNVVMRVTSPKVYVRPFIRIAVLLLSLPLWSQEFYHFKDAELFARPSYDQAPSFKVGDIDHVCIAISRKGDYRIVRSVKGGESQWLHGIMPEQQFQQVRKLLSDARFKRLSGVRGGVIRRRAQRFAAEVHRDDSTQRLQWLNADGEDPFPDSVDRIISWVTHFEPIDATPFEYAEYPDVCPIGGVRLTDPSVAANVNP